MQWQWDFVDHGMVVQAVAEPSESAEVLTDAPVLIGFEDGSEVRFRHGERLTREFVKLADRMLKKSSGHRGRFSGGKPLADSSVSGVIASDR
jgi:hypothetical protein